MIFDFVPNLLSSVITILFPIFASYKALRSSDPAQLTPWLMYWVVFACFGLFDYWTYFVLSWVPFYAWARLIVLSYLVLPQTQGARLIYQSYVNPFLLSNESQIEQMIVSAHEKANAFGLGYVERIIELFRQYVLGQRPFPPSSSQRASSASTLFSFIKDSGVNIPVPVSAANANYVQNLLSRFTLPAARQGSAAPASDFYGLLSSAMSIIISTSTSTSGSAAMSRDAQVETLSRSGTLIPPEITSPSEKMTFLATQRERLRVLLSALDKEASDLGTEAAIQRDVSSRLASGGSLEGEILKKSKSETEFEEISPDGPEATHGPGKDRKASSGTVERTVSSSSSWLPWGRAGGQAKSTGVDTGK